jgi:hypothetical protein
VTAKPTKNIVIPTTTSPTTSAAPAVHQHLKRRKPAGEGQDRHGRAKRDEQRKKLQGCLTAFGPDAAPNVFFLRPMLAEE